MLTRPDGIAIGAQETRFISGSFSVLLGGSTGLLATGGVWIEQKLSSDEHENLRGHSEMAIPGR